MTAWKVLLVLLLLLLLVGQIRVGGVVSYSADGLRVLGRLGLFRMTLYPREKKAGGDTAERKKLEKKKATPHTEKKEGESEEGRSEKGGPLAPVKELLPLIGDAAGGLKRRIRIDELTVTLTVAGANAAGTAMSFGYANAVIAPILALLQNSFQVKEYHVQTRMDFQADSSVIALRAAVSARIGQILSLALLLGWKLLRLHLAQKRQEREQREQSAPSSYSRKAG